MSEAATLTTEFIPTLTPLAVSLQARLPGAAPEMYAGALTLRSLSATPRQEVAAAVTTAACFDLGYRTRIRVTGEDRLRWLNGMVSNTIQALPEGSGNYNFILNAQGRIQGDAYIYRRGKDLLIDTDRSQSEALLAHLDHFIIMDDVELARIDEISTGIGLIGPQAAAILKAAGVEPTSLGPQQFVEVTLAGAPVTLVRAFSILFPRFELWLAPEDAVGVWQTLNDSGATPIGSDAVEALRILEGTPRYGIDITERHLPQETAQNRALNFAKGCYLGQEIVERIRSRATVHRSLRQFRLDGSIPVPPAELLAEAGAAASIGQLTSIAEIDLSEFEGSAFHGVVAIGSLRTEALARSPSVAYQGGFATALDRPPLPLSP